MNFPLSGRGGFVAVKVIRQHMFFFALSYNLYDNLFGENMIVLAHQNRDRMAICRPVIHLSSGLHHSKFVIVVDWVVLEKEMKM